MLIIANTHSFSNIFFYRTYNKNLSVDDMKNYYDLDNFTYLVVKANDLYFGFDLSEAEEYQIAVKIVTKSYSVVGIDLGGWKVSRILPRWIKNLNSWKQFVDDYVVEKGVDEEEEEEEEEEGEVEEEEEEEEVDMVNVEMEEEEGKDEVDEEDEEDEEEEVRDCARATPDEGGRGGGGRGRQSLQSEDVLHLPRRVRPTPPRREKASTARGPRRSRGGRRRHRRGERHPQLHRTARRLRRRWMRDPTDDGGRGCVNDYSEVRRGRRRGSSQRRRNDRGGGGVGGGRLGCDGDGGGRG